VITTLEIEVESKIEAEAIKRALQDPGVMAYVKIVGLLLPMGQRARKRIH